MSPWNQTATITRVRFWRKAVIRQLTCRSEERAGCRNTDNVQDTEPIPGFVAQQTQVNFCFCAISAASSIAARAAPIPAIPFPAMS